MINGEDLFNMIKSSNQLKPEEIKKINEIYHELEKTEVNILFIGRTGVGKSSTINTLLGTKHAKIDSIKPGTDEIQIYNFKNLKVYDSPGFGESKEKDEKIRKEIFNLITKKNAKGEGLIDIIFFIFDANSRDYSESYIIINEFISKLLDNPKRLVLALNKIDLIEGGMLYDKTKNQPENKLHDLINDKIKYMKTNLKEDYDIIYYCAGINNSYAKLKPYNIISFYIQIKNILTLEKRLVVELNLNEIEDNFEKGNNNKQSYTWGNFFYDIFGGFLYGFMQQTGENAANIFMLGAGLFAYFKIKNSDIPKKVYNKLKNTGQFISDICSTFNGYHPPLCDCQKCENERFVEGIALFEENAVKFGKKLMDLYQNIKK